MAAGRSDRLPARARRSLSRIDPRLDWPHGLVRLGVASCLGLAVAFGLVYFVKEVDRLDGDASRNAAVSYDDRAFGGAEPLGVDTVALTEARGRIPEHATYRLELGPSDDDIGQYARYFLMPRRPDPHARWVLCYGCDPTKLGAALHVVWRNDAGVVLGRLPA